MSAISAAQSGTVTLVRGWKGAGKDYEVLVPKIEKAQQIRLRVKSYKLHRQRSWDMHGRARISLSDQKVENILIRCRETTATTEDIVHL